MKNFDGSIVLVTGSVRNTGFEIARAFLQNGATVYINGRSTDSVQSAIKRLHDTVGTSISNVREAVCDVSVFSQVESLFQKIRSESGRLDVLVNNAVVQGNARRIHEIDIEEFEQTIRTNLHGYFHCAREAARIMIDNGGGCIVNISSNTSQRAIRNRSAYVMTKGGIDAFTRAMAVDLGHYGIRINTVAPGYIHTDRWNSIEPGLAERRRKNVPLGKEAMGYEVAQAVLFMASPEAGNISGSRLVVDGGCSAQHMPVECDC